MSNDANITGRGADIMLPPQGNPFKSNPEAIEPADLTPAEVESQLGSSFGSLATPGMGQALAVGEADMSDGVGGIEEPTDLTPADLAAMFPASPDERNTLPEPTLEFNEAPSLGAGSPGVRAQSARAPMAIRAHDPGRQSKNYVDINAFNPDASIGKPRRMGKGAVRLGKIDIEAFDPDAPAGLSDSSNVEVPRDASAMETGSIKADLESTDTPELNFASETPLANYVNESAAPPADAPLIPEPMPIPEAASLFSEPPVTPSPTAGFQPYDPFAPSGGRSEAASQASPIPSTTSLGQSVATSSVQSVTTSSVESAATLAQGGVTTETVSTMSAVRREIVTDEDLSGHKQALPTAPMIAFPDKEDEFILNLLVTNDRIEQLWTRIDRAEMLAVADENSLPGQRAENFENLKAARNLILGGRKNYEDALRYVMEVESDLHYAGRVRHWSSTWATGILAYNIFWLALLVFGYTQTNRVVVAIVDAGLIDKNFGLTVWLAILSGGLGGVVKAFFSLVTHVTKQDFDTQHRIWYWTSPIIGSVLGIFVIFFSQLGLTSIGTGVGTSLNASLVVYSLAWIIGYNQNILLELIDRVKETLLPDKKDKA